MGLARISGKERDSESGLDYFGARYYSSALGRFTSPDWSAKLQAVPYVNLADPQSLNLYSYVSNNPLGKVDSDGHCSAPSGLKSGQVGVCIDTYIQARTVPVAVPGAGLAFGDGRGPASNNKNATYRQEIQLVMTPGGKPQMVKNDGGGSIAESFGVVVYGKGQSNTTVSDPITDKDGTEHFNVSSTGLNGLAWVPFAPTDTIKTSLNFSVTADGKVGLDTGGTRTAYPSIEVYSYGSDGSTRSLLQRTESGNIDDLKRQNQPIPAVSPQ
jgi:RHS repeat-associated protein